MTSNIRLVKLGISGVQKDTFKVTSLAIRGGLFLRLRPLPSIEVLI